MSNSAHVIDIYIGHNLFHLKHEWKTYTLIFTVIICKRLLYHRLYVSNIAWLISDTEDEKIFGAL